MSADEGRTRAGGTRGRTAAAPPVPVDAPAPVAPVERYVILDVVRGFSLFGVLLANMVLTTQFLALTDEQRWVLSTATIDDVAVFCTKTFIDGKFYTLFSVLFGLGFAVQLSRAAARGASVLPTYARRLAVLFAIGVAHGMLLWFGDVLHIYAALGFVLILFSGRSDRVVLGWAIGIAALAFCMPLLDSVAQAQGWEYPVLFGRSWTAAERHEIIAAGSYADVVRLNWEVHLEDYGVLGFDGGILTWYLDILWRFLLGFLIGRRMLLQHARQHLDGFRRVLPWALLIGIGGNALMSAASVYDAWHVESRLLRAVLSSVDELWVVALAVGYVCALVLLHERPRWRRVVEVFAPVGRMALTSYLTHSVCMLALFYGIGFGLIGRAGAAACVLASVVIFAAQVVFSSWWLRRFRFGPVEWIWRALTYGTRPKMRVS